ncbi:AAA family ATPase [Candidatus Sulfidibacterium hydrothermale]|uniref:shikimate kinase n=1 Tax=Candidatus Sulfidibacterium hydrothermale TaxID=2875962 RepID=UPI001F0A97FE|nr:shikimate kinase [Candidatus Sulfidibacterium hydrothermale]UBM61238.1 AAA family ATPase [Candidatus Sulfidibacterium hydrothermale]
MIERIYLVGFMGAGKSTLGKKLARALEYRFVDMDDFFEERYKIEIHDFFQKYDESLFRKLEHDLLLKTFTMSRVVVATGGGTPCVFQGMEKMNRHGLTVYLKMPPAALAQRLLNAKRKRPLVQGKTGEALIRYIEEKLAERKDCYEMAQLHSNLPGDTLDVLIEKINSWQP